MLRHKIAASMALLILTASCAAPASPEPTARPTANPTLPPVPTPTFAAPTETSTAEPALNYEVLSPTVIQKGELVFEVSANLLNCSQLAFQVNASLPQDFSFAGGSSVIFENVVMEALSSQVTLRPTSSPAGGGGGAGNNVHRGQVQAYGIDPPLSAGQEIHLTALVTLNPAFGITQPVPFDLDVIAQQCP